jgi:hypothetical protein
MRGQAFNPYIHLHGNVMNGFYVSMCKFLTCTSLHVSKPTHYTLQESIIIKHFTHENFN